MHLVSEVVLALESDSLGAFCYPACLWLYQGRPPQVPKYCYRIGLYSDFFHDTNSQSSTDGVMWPRWHLKAYYCSPNWRGMLNRVGILDLCFTLRHK